MRTYRSTRKGVSPALKRVVQRTGFPVLNAAAAVHALWLVNALWLHLVPHTEQLMMAEARLALAHLVAHHLVERVCRGHKA